MKGYAIASRLKKKNAYDIYYSIRNFPGGIDAEAVAVAAGAWLAGRRTVAMCQNSGLGNTVNPLTSLNYPSAFRP